MYKAAIDESGSHENAPAIAVAACLMTSTQWRHFAREWEPTARRYPRGFHATDATPEDRAILADLLARRLEAGMVITIDYQDFKAVVPERIRSAFGAEYNAGVRACVVALDEWCEKNRINWLAYVLEVGHRGAESARQWLDEIVRQPGHHIFSHTWVGKEDLTTHAPDLIAYEMANCYGKSLSETLTKLQPHLHCTHFDRERLASAVDVGHKSLNDYARLRDEVRAIKKADRKCRKGL